MIKVMKDAQTIPQISLKKQTKDTGSSSESILIPKLLNSSPEKLQNFQTVKEASPEKRQPFFENLRGKPIIKIATVVLVILLIFILSVLIPGLSVYKRAKQT